MARARPRNLPAGNPSAVRPRVSIIILNWNNGALTLQCVESVRRHTCAVTYEIIVVDNGSARGDLDALKDGLSGAHLISLNQNMFFGEGNNIAADIARGDFLLFLNNDVLLTPGCVESLVAAFDTCFAAGAIGPKFLYPDGRLQEAGSFLMPTGWPFQQGKHGTEVAPHFDRGCHIVDYCSAACLLVRRDAFISLAGFDPLFDPAYFEDCDLCLRLRSIGLYTYYASDVAVVHDESTTSTKLWDRAARDEIVAANHERFVQRWGDYLAQRLERDVPFPQFPEIPDIAPLPPDATDRERVLLRSETNIRMADDTYALLRRAAALGPTSRIVIATPEVCSRLRIRSICQKLDIKLPNFELERLV